MNFAQSATCGFVELLDAKGDGSHFIRAAHIVRISPAFDADGVWTHCDVWTIDGRTTCVNATFEQIAEAIEAETARQ
jgi:hypothetical protein